jgi:alkanesulfonate monooxygenase SsuD/methylene tetrahydromethanopterin reductase-like flavin-dependent oxidoreductase (luciferase family)
MACRPDVSQTGTKRRSPCCAPRGRPGRCPNRGEAWTIDGVDVQPKPVDGQIPIWFGGNGDTAIDRAARLGDGWTGAGAAPWSGNAAYLETVRSALDRHGRDPAEFTIGKRIYFAVEPDRAKALRRLREVFGIVYGRSELADTAAISGSVEQLRDELGRLVELGCEFVMLHPVYDVDEHLAIAAEQVVPELRRS